MLVLGLAPGARAEEPEEPGPPTSTGTEGGAATPAAGDAAPPWRIRFGIRLSAGAPEGLNAAGIVHAMRWLRLSVGGTMNNLGSGINVGASLIPLDLALNPVLGVEVGHIFDADYARLLTQVRGEPTPSATLIKNVGYDYVTATLGLEYSPVRRVTLSGSVGISYGSIRVSNTATFIRDAADTADITAQPLTLSLTSPAVKLGVTLYFN